MLIWLVHRYAHLLEAWELISSAERRAFLTTRTALAGLTAFLLAILLGPAAIGWLKGRFRERIASDSARLNELHAAKNQTPTMGGLFILAALLTATLLWGDLTNRYVHLALFLAVGYGAIGAADDWVKLSSRKKGLTARQKMAWLVVVGGLVSGLLFAHHHGKDHGHALYVPFSESMVPLGALFVAWGAFVLVGASNAVNLTDGLDGLAAGCMVFAGTGFTALAYLAGHKVLADHLRIPYLPGCGEFAVVLGATVGAVLGFLWFNSHPAQVFMGDTGSLPLGGLIALAALATRQELLLVVVGGVFVVETLSVMAQVAGYKLTRKRLLACSPLHNHFLFKGMHETKIVTRFWIVGALLAVVALASLKLR
jgi:phospho-N-acetylmuramoyl-pentapeptide-transferase